MEQQIALDYLEERMCPSIRLSSAGSCWTKNKLSLSLSLSRLTWLPFPLRECESSFNLQADRRYPILSFLSFRYIFASRSKNLL